VSSESDTQGSKANLAVLDSSAILAWLLRETGGELVEASLPSLVSAVNLAEVVSIAARRGLDVGQVARAVGELPLTVVPFGDDQVYLAASIHSRSRAFGLSLADCACLSLASTSGLPAITADRVWAECSLGIEVRLIR
jgi:PIN domain nuclease of toxin-antitoxin system